MPTGNVSQKKKTGTLLDTSPKFWPSQLNRQVGAMDSTVTKPPISDLNQRLTASKGPANNEEQTQMPVNVAQLF
jgi:hypothetical protein